MNLRTGPGILESLCALWEMRCYQQLQEADCRAQAGRKLLGLAALAMAVEALRGFTLSKYMRAVLSTELGTHGQLQGSWTLTSPWISRHPLTLFLHTLNPSALFPYLTNAIFLPTNNLPSRYLSDLIRFPFIGHFSLIKRP